MSDTGFDVDYLVVQGIKHQGDSDETGKAIVEKVGLGLKRFAKSGSNDRVVFGTKNSEHITARDMVVREAKILARLKHPNIVQVADLRFSQDQNEATLYEQVLEGKKLSEVVQELRSQKDGKNKILDIFKQLASAVDYCHSQGIVYRDLKPDNILVDISEDRPRVQLVDFGVAIDTKNPSFIDTRSSVQPEMYMTSEAWQEKTHLFTNKAMDYQTFGVVFYEALVGEYPFRYISQTDPEKNRRKAHGREDILRLDGVPEDARVYFSNLLSYDQQDRVAGGSLSEMVAKVEECYLNKSTNSALARLRQLIKAK